MKKLTCATIVCLFLLSLCSCSKVKKSDFVGSYELSKAEGVGISLTQEQIDAMKAIGLSATLDIKEDNTAIMNVFGEEIHFTYDLRKMIFTCEGKDEKFTFDGKTIAFNNEGRKLEFTKTL